MLAPAGYLVFGGDLTVGADSLWVHDAEDEVVIEIVPPTPRGFAAIRPVRRRASKSAGQAAHPFRGQWWAA